MFFMHKSLVKGAVLSLSFVYLGVLSQSDASAVENTIEIVQQETVDGNVQLRPGYIAGTIDIGGQNISRIDLQALGGDHQAKIYPSNEGLYTLTVNVPQDSTLDYTVSGTIWMDSWKTRMFLQQKTVNVAESQTSQLDYIIGSGYVTGEIVTNGCSLTSSELWAKRDDGGGYSNASTKLGSETSFRFPVQPNSDILVYGTVQLSTGAAYSLQQKSVDIAPGADGFVSWELPCTSGQLSSIKHDVDYHIPIDSHLTYLYSQGTSSPYRTARHNGSIQFDNLAPGNWRVYTYSYWNNSQNMIGKNFTNITTSPGETAHLLFDEYPGFVRGELTLDGTHTIQDTSYAHVYAYGQNSLYPSYQVFSRSLANNTDGKFELALPWGEYSTYVTALSFFNPASTEADYLNSYLYMYDYSRRSDLLYIDSGEIIDNYDVNYETGSAVIKFSRADGGYFSAPYVNAKSYTYDDANRLQSYVYTSSRAASSADRVTMIGMPGIYEVDAWAYVDGSVTTFGKVEITIVPGVEKVVDIGGPMLNVENPAAGAVFSVGEVVVSGTATDENGIESITINGEEVVFVSSDNPEDENEVKFNAVITLTEGENTLVSIAVDPSGNTSSDSRKVTFTPVVEEGENLAAILDVKPGSCQNPFNLKAKGTLPVVLLGSADFDVTAINPESISLNSVKAFRSVVADGAALVSDGSCETDYADGYADLVMKFDAQKIAAALGSVSDGDVITLGFYAETFEGAVIEAADSVAIINRGKKK